jgi:hypothetical protein
MLVLTIKLPDVSKFLHFSFYEPAYCQSHGAKFPSESNEKKVGGLVLQYTLAIQLHTRCLLCLARLFIDLHFGLLWIQLSKTSVFLHLEGRQYPTTLAIQSSFGQGQKPLRQLMKQCPYQRWMVMIQVSNDVWLLLMVMIQVLSDAWLPLTQMISMEEHFLRI